MINVSLKKCLFKDNIKSTMKKHIRNVLVVFVFASFCLFYFWVFPSSSSVTCIFVFEILQRVYDINIRTVKTEPFFNIYLKFIFSWNTFLHYTWKYFFVLESEKWYFFFGLIFWTLADHVWWIGCFIEIRFNSIKLTLLSNR